MNVSSVSDNAAGLFSLNYTTNLSTTGYAVSAIGERVGANGTTLVVLQNTTNPLGTTGVALQTIENAGGAGVPGTNTDLTYVTIIVVQ
jgi:hypothetical protein